VIELNVYDKLYMQEVNRNRRFKDIERISFEFLKQYEFYGDSKSNLIQVFNTALDGSNNGYSKKEHDELLQDVIIYMKMKYNLIIVSDNPLRMKRKK
jgi:hypothetical protein